MFGLREARATVASVLLAGVVLASASPAARADDPPPIAASELFLRARDRIAAQHLPLFYTYRELLDVNVSGDFRHTDLRVSLRVSDGAMSVTDRTHQPVVESLSLSPVAYARVVSSELPTATTSIFTADANDEPTTTTIGRVRYRSSMFYIVTDTGAAVVDGVRVRHLRFVPRRDPTLHPLREAWIDPVDDRFVQAHVLGRLVLPGMAAPIDLTATFREIAGVTTIVRVTGEGQAEGASRYLAYTVDQRFDDIRAVAAPEASWRLPEEDRH